VGSNPTLSATFYLPNKHRHFDMTVTASGTASHAWASAWRISLKSAINPLGQSDIVFRNVL
jgi:hypothetical protein